MEQQLAKAAALGQKDRTAAYLSILQSALASNDSLPRNIHLLVDTVVNQDMVGLVTARQVLTELVKNINSAVVDNRDLRKAIVEDTLAIVQPRIVSYEEQVNALRFQLADFLEEEEEWSEAARVLMGISMDSSQGRTLQDADKLRVYVRVVRLLLEDEDSIQAETYYNRAASLVHSTADKEILLSYKLCQARISDYSRKFLEAATQYHNLSWIGEIDEEERLHILSAAVTCAVLAPAGPNRSRVLGALCRDERTAQLPTYNILSKMFLDHILRSAEVKEFEKTLKSHQLATIAQSSNDKVASRNALDDAMDGDEIGVKASMRIGPSTVLDRAVMEHNLLASSKIYNNITFHGLGTLLDLAPSAAETMARRMIEQGRLKGSIDQVDRLIWFDAGEDEDAAQGKAGGLGDVEMETVDTGAPFTKRWDMQIRMTAANVESIVEHLADKGLVKVISMTT